MIFRRLTPTLAALFIFCGPAWAVQYTGGNARDPFDIPVNYQPVANVQPEAPIVSENTSFVLTGIIWVPGKPRAIINERRVMEGNEIDGAKVLEIRKKDVKILLNGREVILKPEGET